MLSLFSLCLMDICLLSGIFLSFVVFAFVLSLNQFSFQKARVNNTITLKNSRRPMSISIAQIHFPTAGIVLHDMVGPISKPSVGPTLLAQLSATVMEFVLSKPKAIRVK